VTAADGPTPIRGAPTAPAAGRISRRTPITGRLVATVVVVAVLLFLVIGPLLMLVLSTFRASNGTLPFSPGATWTFDNYTAVFLDPATYRLLFTTLVFCLGSLALSFSVSVMLAWLTERTNMPFRNVVFVLIVASIGIPNVILGIAWDMVLNPVNGLINVFLRDILGLGGRGPVSIFSLPGLIFVQGISLVPITFLLLSAAFRAIDVSLEDAGAVSGGSFWSVARRITLPLLAPALLSAFVYQFVSVIESFDIPLIIGLRGGIPVLSTQIYVSVKPPGGLPDYGLASTYSLFLLALALGPLLFYNRIIGRSERYATITGRGYQPRRVDLGRWKVPALVFGIGFITVGFIIPALVLLWASTQPFYAIPSAEAIGRITFQAYFDLFANPTFHKALLNTIILGLSVGGLTLIIGTLVAWILVRTRSRARVLLDLLSFLPHAMPGVIIGLSVLLIYLLIDPFLPIPIYATLWIIVIALTTQYISLSTRLMSAAIAQVKLELEEAADASGASWLAAMRRIVLPLIRPAFVNGFLLVFLQAIKNLTLALILISPTGIVVSTLIYQFWDRANTAATGALGVVILTITIVLSVALRRANNRGGTVVA
jgi:iron(III) transport system permease protein